MTPHKLQTRVVTRGGLPARVLALLADEGAMRCSQLKQRAMAGHENQKWYQAHVVHMTKELEYDGLLARYHRDGVLGRRARWIAITLSGLAALEALEHREPARPSRPLQRVQSGGAM